MNWINNTLAKLIFRHAVNVLGAWLTTKGIVDGSGWEQLVGALSVAAAVLHSIWDKRALIIAEFGKLKGGGVSVLVVLLLPAGLLFTGCTSVVNVPQGKILSVTERGLGFHVKAQNTTTQSPDLVFGFWSSAVIIIPTSTNGPTQSPNFANTFDFAQSGMLQLGIGESIASGNYQTRAPGATNSAPTAQPVRPQ